MAVSPHTPGQDLSAAALAEVLADRPLRTYPALLSTEADACAWARSGGPEGALVVADFQAAARGRAGREWTVRQGQGLCFSLLLRPDLPPEREGWVYAVGVSGLADLTGQQTRIAWPDEVHGAGGRVGGVAVQAGLAGERVDWAVLSVQVVEAEPPRGPLLARAVDAIEARYRRPPDEVLADYLPRCATIGQDVRARLVPLGPAGPEVVGRAVGVTASGALVIDTAGGKRTGVPPQDLGVLELSGS